MSLPASRNTAPQPIQDRLGVTGVCRDALGTELRASGSQHDAIKPSLNFCTVSAICPLHRSGHVAEISVDISRRKPAHRLGRRSYGVAIRRTRRKLAKPPIAPPPPLYSLRTRIATEGSRWPILCHTARLPPARSRHDAPAYLGTTRRLRSRLHPLPHTVTETTGPSFSASRFPRPANLTMATGKPALGERIVSPA